MIHVLTCEPSFLSYDTVIMASILASMHTLPEPSITFHVVSPGVGAGGVTVVGATVVTLGASVSVTITVPLVMALVVGSWADTHTAEHKRRGKNKTLEHVSFETGQIG